LYNVDITSKNNMSQTTRLWTLLVFMALSACQSAPDNPGTTGAMRMVQPAGAYLDGADMPLPGHWGTLGATLGEDGQALGVLLIGAEDSDAAREDLSPIAAVQWESGGAISTCIIATPADSTRCRLQLRDYMDLRLSQDAYYRLLDIWLQHELMPDGATWLGWQNEVYAGAEIARSRSRFSASNQ
jgi:inorganic pyrophosphatase